MIVIPHIAKTGGMSFRGYLQETFGGLLHMDYPGLQGNFSSRWRRWVQSPLRASPTAPNRWR